MDQLFAQLATELQVALSQIQAAVALLDSGSTVPFIARYRKEATGGLDDTQLRLLEERLGYLRELEERRRTILQSIEQQGKMSDELRTAIETAENKARLEDLYLPYKPRRVTKGRLAIEAGLEPLADLLWSEPEHHPEHEANAWLRPDQGYADVRAVLEGARFILMERWAENADLIQLLRNSLIQDGLLFSKVVAGKEQAGQKFRDYFEHQSSLQGIPSHRALALFRGRNEGILQLRIDFPEETASDSGSNPSKGERLLAVYLQWQSQNRPADAWLSEVMRWTWKVKLQPHLETELLSSIKDQADQDAIQVFARNLKDLLMAAPAGMRPTLGLDPGIRTGVKVAVINATGQLVDHTVIFPHEPRKDWEGSLQKLQELCQQHQIELIAIGNGTASRETDQLVAELIKRYPQLHLTRIVVSEAGASVYSASETAAREFPDLDVSYRGAVSIARRLQDPMAELVKIDPKSIGVGQYQHDVQQSRLARSLDAVVEDCVSNVGVDLNTASAPLLARIAGLNSILAGNIVSWRNEHGRFLNRRQLKEVPRVGERTFEQAAGFLRISKGENPLDSTSVHPEAYPVVERLLQQVQKPIQDVMGHVELLRSIKPETLVDERFGVPTVQDILQELEKPGRDPRPEFRAPQFADGIHQLKDLKIGMVLEGVVTNVTNFGAFVDIGVHQDGLVHISALTDRFIKDPHEVIKAGDIVKVKILEVDHDRSRIALSMRLKEREPQRNTAPSAPPKEKNNRPTPDTKPAARPASVPGKTPTGKPVSSGKASLGDLLRKAGLSQDAS